MTPTREQLELAAKVVGIEIHHWFDNDPRITIPEPTDLTVKYRTWQPVTDKSDNRDLELACEIELKFFSPLGIKANDAWFYYKDYNNDKGLATMWAVFLCAVEIGRAM